MNTSERDNASARRRLSILTPGPRDDSRTRDGPPDSAAGDATAADAALRHITLATSDGTVSHAGDGGLTWAAGSAGFSFRTTGREDPLSGQAEHDE